MRMKGSVLSLGLVFWAGMFVASVQAPAKVYAYRNGLWFDGARFVPGAVDVEDGVFRMTQPARVDSTIDLRGGFVVPPFGEAHNHILEPALVRTYVAKYLIDGVFYVRDLGNAPYFRTRIDSAFNRPTSIDFIS